MSFHMCLRFIHVLFLCPLFAYRAAPVWLLYRMFAHVFSCFMCFPAWLLALRGYSARALSIANGAITYMGPHGSILPQVIVLELFR